MLGNLLLLAIIPALVLLVVTNRHDMQPDSVSVDQDTVSVVAYESNSNIANSAGPAVRTLQTARKPDRPAIRAADRSSIPEHELNMLLERRPVLECDVVEIDSEQLREAIRRDPTESFVSFDLFGQTVTLVTEYGREYVEGPRNGYAVWRGTTEHADWSYASLRINPNGQMSGEIQAPTIGFATIESLGEGGMHVIWLMDDTKISQDME